MDVVVDKSSYDVLRYDIYAKLQTLIEQRILNLVNAQQTATLPTSQS